MKIVKSLLVIAVVVCAGSVSAQVMLRPVKAQPAATEAAPDWLARTNQLEKRIIGLEQKLGEANQQIAQLRGEYDGHTHGSAVGNLVYNGQGGIAGFKQNAFVWTTTRPSQREPAVAFTN